MDEQAQQLCTAFEGSRCIAAGILADVARAVKAIIDRGEQAPVLIFDDRTSELVEVNFSGSMADVLTRLAQPEPEPAPSPADAGAPRGPGRPRLGVVAREVTLLPRHWDWLGSQPGGASVALRKLVEEASRVNRVRDQVRQAQAVAYRFMSAMAGNLPGFEAATRALFAGEADRFDEIVAPWPGDIRAYAHKLSAAAFPRRGA